MSVYICDKPFNLDLEGFEGFEGLVLSDFQKYSFYAISNECNSLVTAGTGSGKTLSLYFAISFFKKKNKKIIYTSPIKALSNQKYYELTTKFKDVSFGLITGDIKTNPDADVVIMTCEILRNKLKDSELENVACVVFDEVHYINDEDRGTVWEECIISLPKNISLVLLSATLDRPESFAKWISNIRQRDTYVSGIGLKRIVPLMHYSLLFYNSSSLKIKELEQLKVDGPILLQDQDTFKPEAFDKVQKIIKLLNKNSIKMNKFHVANEVVKYLNEKELTPAIYFCLSKNEIYNYVSSIQTNLINDFTISLECRHILKKLDNYQDFMSVPEYDFLLKSLQKGIAYHHAGMLSIYRELVEILFAKGLIKVLFATETFSVGLNMPTKSVVFDSFSKYDGSKFRYLKSHEYTQMAGRAGRRSIDTIGYVFHLNNLFDECPDFYEYKHIMSNTPLKIRSKFKMSYNMILDDDLLDSCCKDTILKAELDEFLKQIEVELEEKQKEHSQISKDELLNQYINLLKNKDVGSQKVRKNNQQELKNFDSATITKYNKLSKLESEIKSLVDQKEDNQNYLFNQYNNLKKDLLNNDFYDPLKKTISKGIKEIHPLVFTEVLLYLQSIENIGIDDIACIFYIFCSNDHEEEFENEDAFKKEIKKCCNKYHYDIFYNYETFKKWINASTKEECNIILKDVKYLGTFSKCVLKLNNLVQEIMTITVLNVDFLHKVSQIPEKTLKYIITNQSLYL